jgi:Transposase DDE domain
VWLTDEAVQAWRAEPRTTPGGPPHYSVRAITTALFLRTTFGLALRQTEGLIGSVIGLLGLDLPVQRRRRARRRRLLTRIGRIGRLAWLILLANGKRDVHDAVASTTGRGRSGRTVIAINTPATPIADDAT